MKLLHINRNEHHYLRPDFTAYVQASSRDHLLVLADMMHESEIFDFALTSLFIEPSIINLCSNEKAELTYIGSFHLTPNEQRNDMINMYYIKGFINAHIE